MQLLQSGYIDNLIPQLDTDLLSRQETEARSSTQESEWVKTPVANLIRYKPSGVYFARVRIRGKLFRASLKTTVMSVAKLRLKDFIEDKQEDMGDSVLSGKMTVDDDCVTIFRDRLQGRQWEWLFLAGDQSGKTQGACKLNQAPQTRWMN